MHTRTMTSRERGRLRTKMWARWSLGYIMVGLVLLVGFTVAQNPSLQYISPRNSQNNLLLFSKANRQHGQQLQQQHQHPSTHAQGIFAAPLLGRIGAGTSLNHVLAQGQGLNQHHASGNSHPQLDDEEVEEVEYEYYEDPNGDVIYYEDVSSSTTGNPLPSSTSSASGRVGSGSTGSGSGSVSASLENLSGRKVHPSRLNLPPKPTPPPLSPSIFTTARQEQFPDSVLASDPEEEYETVYYDAGSAEQHKSNENVQTQLTVSVSTKNAPPPPPEPASSSSTTNKPPKRIVSFTKTSPTPRAPSVGASVGNGGLRFQRPTGSSIVVAVQTSRSVVTPATAASDPTTSASDPSSSTHGQSHAHGEVAGEYEEGEETYPDNYPLQASAEAVAPTTATSTDKPPSPSIRQVTESIMDKLDQVGSDLVNRLFNTPQLGSPGTTSPTKSVASIIGIGRKPTPSSATNPTTTSATTTTASASSSSTPKVQQDSGIKFEDVSAFLPPDYFAKKGASSAEVTTVPSTPTTSSSTTTVTTTPTTTTAKNPFKIQFQEVDLGSLAALLPKDYVLTMSTSTSTSTTTTTPAPSSTSTDSAKPKDQLLESLMKKIHFEDVSALLPPGYKESLLNKDGAGSESSTAGPTTSSTYTPEAVFTFSTAKPAAGTGGVVFPTRPGGLKPFATRSTTPEPARAESPPPPKVALKSGWPTRKMTEFTGWPTVSTEPTTTTPSTTTLPTTTTTTTRRTTTTQPPKRSPPSTCEENSCKMEATLRIVSGVRWKAPFSDVNTEEWRQLESTMKRELDGAYRSSGLAPYYKAVKIEAFNRGSVIVDYFVYLDGVNRAITSEQMRAFFHGALLQTTVNAGVSDTKETGNGEEPQETLRLGRYLVIDPRYTDFKVRNSTNDAADELVQAEALLPHWAIAVIVLSLACLIFVVIFVVTVVVTRSRNAKKKSTNVSLTQEMLNEFNKTHGLGSGGSVAGYGGHQSHHGALGGIIPHPAFSHPDDLYNMDDVWSDTKAGGRTFDRKPAKRSSIISGGRESTSNYNIYDSWKTEWNGYSSNNLTQNAHGSSTSAGCAGGSYSHYGDSQLSYVPRRRPPVSDYDTNF